jgi:hypothetical protein
MQTGKAQTFASWAVFSAGYLVVWFLKMISHFLGHAHTSAIGNDQIIPTSCFVKK